QAEAELGVILEERVGPRGTAAVSILAIRRGRQVSAVDGRAAGGVCHHQPVSEHLREQLEVRRFAATGARARKLDQGSHELRAFDIELELLSRRVGQREKVVPVDALGLEPRSLRNELERLALGICPVLRRANLDTKRASRAILGRDLDGVALTRILLRAK